MPLTTIPLPNASDRDQLKATAATLIRACPELHAEARLVAREILGRYGLPTTDPETVYYHRFNSAQSNSNTFTGWEHRNEQPHASLTLVQLVIHRFLVTDQDNADLLDVNGGFYSAGPEHQNFDQTNEVRLHGNEVLNDLWRINFSERYHRTLDAFWADFSEDFRSLAKCNFLNKAVLARDKRQLSDADFHTVIKATCSPLTWPVSLATLRSETPTDAGLKVCKLSIADYVAIDILCIGDPAGRQIIYVPGDDEAFHTCETPRDLHWWVLIRMNDKASRTALLMHFQLSDRQAINDEITPLMNRMVGAWGKADYNQVNRRCRVIQGDAFSALRDSTREALLAEAEISLTSNGQMRQQLWLGYLTAGLRAFGPLSLLGWPIALPVIGASLSAMGLNIDKAANAKTSAERKDAVIDAVLAGINTLFNLPLLKEIGPLAELDADAEAAEMAHYRETAQPAESPAPEQTPGQTPQQLRSLLWHNGMFVFEQADDGLVILHHTRTGAIVRHSIERTASGAFFIDAQAWPLLKGARYNSLAALARALEEQGLQRVNVGPALSQVSEATGTSTSGLDQPLTPGQNNGAVQIPVAWQLNEILEGATPMAETGKFRCIYQLNSDPPNAILKKDAAYAVRYEDDINGAGNWAIIDPANPNASEGSLPVRLNAQGEWELAPKLALKGGMLRSVFNRTAPVPALPASAYDIPPNLRPLLREAALTPGNPALHEDYGDLDLLGSGAANPYDDFKTVRQQLYQDAVNDYANIVLPPRPHLPALAADANAETIVSTLLQEARGIVIGENHAGIGSKQWLIENMPLLARQGVKTLYMEHLLTDFHQTALHAFARSGEMPEALEQYLAGLDTGHSTDPLKRYTFLEVVKAARQNRIQVQAIDCMASYRLEGFEPVAPQGVNVVETLDDPRIKMMNFYARSIINTDQAVRGVHKWVALVGETHANTFEGVPGLSEREEAVGVRVEDVAQGESEGIIVDPGRTGIELIPHRAYSLKSDLLLQVETPWAGQESRTLEDILPCKGMFTLQRSRGPTQLVHRANDNAIVSTAINTDGGRYFIERPSWPAISGKRFKSMIKLIKAVQAMGLTLADWSQPL